MAVGAWASKVQLVDLKPRQTSQDALRQLRINAVHTAVVVGVRWLEGLLEVSTRPSALNDVWLLPEQIVAGQVLKGIITRLNDHGARVRLARGVYATCTADNLADRRLKRPQDKFKVGQAMQCIVLESEVSFIAVQAERHSPLLS